MIEKLPADAALNTLQETVQALTLELAKLSQDNIIYKSEIGSLRTQLAEVRNSPSGLLKERMAFKLLKSLSKKTWLFSERHRLRFLKSACKRDPLRSLNSMPSQLQAMQEISGGHTQRGKGHLRNDPKKRNVLLFCHEASQTGAPILGHNIAFEMCKRHNVTIVCLRGGSIVEYLKEVCTWIEVLEGRPVPGNGAWSTLKALLTSQDYAFAVVNSVESRSVLPLLREFNIASIALLHEFASYILPTNAFPEVAKDADQIVFSSPITLDNALDTLGFWRAPQMHILPQGKSFVPGKTLTSELIELERQRIFHCLRPSGTENDLLVVGAGTVNLRKGVELFIEAARVALERAGGHGIRFCWVGAGYNPEQDSLYSTYLKDQIRRSGLEDHLIILGHTTEIDYVHDIADVFLLTSRLDPLPNVAIDAMYAGNPVLCFDKASGFAPILNETGMKEDCVAPYLDTTALGHKVANLALDRKKLGWLSQCSKELAVATFKMEEYVLEIERLAEEAAQTLAHREADRLVIDQHKTDYFAPFVATGSTRKDLVTQYFKNTLRRPEPGFNPHAYALNMQQTGLAPSNPYASYLRAGRPSGSWKQDIIEGPAERRASSLRVALQIHAYYTDELPRIIAHLMMNATTPDLYISVSNAQNEQAALNLTKDYSAKVVIAIMPNIGRDIAPLLTGFGKHLVENYDVIGHVHTKKSLAHADSKCIQRWTDFLYENVIGGEKGGAMLDATLAEFEQNSRLGIVYPSDPHIIGWTLNRAPAEKLREKFGYETLPEFFDFPVGTMFWMRAQTLAKFVDLKLDWDDYPAEPLSIDGTWLHAMERLFGVVPALEGQEIKVTAIQGVSR